MINIPAILQTREDYLRALKKARANAKHARAALAHFAGLLNARWFYAYSRDLAAGETPDGELPGYRVVEDEETGLRAQLQLQENPSAKIFKLGFTVAEVETIITELEALQ